MKFFHRLDLEMEQIPLTHNQVICEKILKDKKMLILKEILFFKPQAINFNMKMILYTSEDEVVDTKKKGKSINVDQMKILKNGLKLKITFSRKGEVFYSKTGTDQIIIEHL